MHKIDLMMNNECMHRAGFVKQTCRILLGGIRSSTGDILTIRPPESR